MFELNRVDWEQRFNDANPNSWWYCLTPNCRRAFQKQDSEPFGFCPFCHSAPFNFLPWELVTGKNPNFPEIPIRGSQYH